MTDRLAVPQRPAFFFDRPLCGKRFDVRLSKKQKPFVTCDECSLQMFVRGPGSVARFNELAHAADGHMRSNFAGTALPAPNGRPGRPTKESTEPGNQIAGLAPVMVVLGRRHS